MCRRYKLALLFCCFLAGSGMIAAQKVSFSVQHYGVQDGLPDHRVWSLLEHSSGFVYVGTARGLAVFDGYTCKIVHTDDEDGLLKTRSIWGLTEVEDGRIAMRIANPAMRDGGEQRLLYDPSNYAITIITEDAYQEMIAPATQQQPTASPPERKGFDYRRQDVHGNVFQSAVSETGRPTEARLTLSTGEKIDLSRDWSTLIKPSFPFGANLGNVMYWIGHNGLMRISVHRSPFDVFLNEDVEDWEYRTVCRAMIDLNKDSVLIATQWQGLFVFDRRHNRVAPVIFRDIDRESFNAQHFRSLWSPTGTGEVYGSAGPGLFNMHIARGKIEAAIPRGDAILAAAPMGDHRCVVSRIRDSEAYWIEMIDLDDTVSEMLIVTDGQRVLNSARGTYLLPVADTAVWYGTKSGLFLLDVRNNAILHLYLSKDAERKPYPVPVSYILSGPHVWVLHYAHDGKLWIGLDGDGLNVLDVNSGEVEYISIADGLPSNTVVGILPDSTGHWISTFSGLAHYNTGTGQFRNFFKSNGISHDEFNRFSFMIDRYGKYYFGSMNGVTSFYPQDVLKLTEELDLLLSEIAHFDRKTRRQTTYTVAHRIPGPITLPSDQRRLSIKLALNDFNYPEGNVFYYKLIPKSLFRSRDEVPWTTVVAGRELRFDNLQAGRYDLHLKGVSSAGVTSNTLILPIRVNELFYRTWWFIGAAALVIFGVLYLLHAQRLRQALRISQLRTRLSSDLHDSVGGLLSGVAFQMDALEHTVDEKNRKIIRRVARSSRKAMDAMRDVVWAIDSRQETVQDLVERMLEFSEEVLAPLGIHYAVKTDNVPAKKVLPTEIRHNLLLIYKECINNTIKHAQASSVVTRLSKQGKMLEMTVTDDGIGLAENAVAGTGQGLRNMRLRAQRINGTMEIEAGLGFGVTLRVPV